LILVGVAGSWEGWKDPANDEWLHTCTIITGEPNEFVREIHIRMPVILPEEHHDAWLSGEAGKEILVRYPADRMKRCPVDARGELAQKQLAEIIAPIHRLIPTASALPFAILRWDAKMRKRVWS
jgi:putative SOS response-associated peptidase YedK